MPAHFSNGASTVQIAVLVDMVERRLPPSYLGFLMAYNGLAISGEDVLLPLPLVTDGAVRLDVLFGVHATHPDFTVIHANRVLRHELAKVMTGLVIGRGGKNLYVLDLTTEAVYYWDRARIHVPLTSRAPHGGGEHFYLVSPTFGTFCELIAKRTRNLDSTILTEWPDVATIHALANDLSNNVNNREST